MQMTHLESRLANRIRVITEAYVLLDILAPGETLRVHEYDRGELHLEGLIDEFPHLHNYSRMAHKLADRLQFKPAVGFWRRLRWLLSGK